ncbi:MAG: GldG family protein [Pseudobacteriovorax sp.]|nr:GldG family protein [Pseudobacteriovorax sp.]
MKKKRSKSKIAIIFFNIFGFIFLISWNFFTLDLSSERLYSLSRASIKIAHNLNQSVDVQLYLPPDYKDLLPRHQRYLQRVVRLFQTYERIAEGNIRLSYYRPSIGNRDELKARSLGIAPAMKRYDQPVYLNAVFLSEINPKIIMNLDPDREKMLEFDISENLQNITAESRKKIALHSSLNILGGGLNKVDEWAVFKSLSRIFEVSYHDLESTISADFSALVLIHPMSLTKNQEYMIDQYLMNGGNLYIALDSFSRVSLTRRRINLLQGPNSDSRFSDIPILLKHWGLKYETMSIVGDQTLSQKEEDSNYPFIIQTNQDNINSEHAISSNISELLFAEASSFTWSQTEALTINEIVSLGPTSGAFKTELAYFLSADDLAGRFASDGQPRTIAAILSGRFTSAFSEPPEGLKDFDHTPQRNHDGHVVVVGDTDFLIDAYSVEKIPFYDRLNMRAINDNQTFFINAVEFLAGNQELLSIRTGNVIQNRFTFFDKLRQKKKSELSHRTKTITSDINNIQKTIDKIVRDNEYNINKNDEQVSQLGTLREKQSRLIEESREIKHESIKEIKLHMRLLEAFNLLFPTLLLGSIGFAVFRRQKKQSVR